MSKRSVFLKNENINDFLEAFVKSGMDKKRFTWERLKQNGMTHERETKFREHCGVVGFILPKED